MDGSRLLSRMSWYILPFILPSTLWRLPVQSPHVHRLRSYWFCWCNLLDLSPWSWSDHHDPQRSLILTASVTTSLHQDYPWSKAVTIKLHPVIISASGSINVNFYYDSSFVSCSQINDHGERLHDSEQVLLVPLQPHLLCKYFKFTSIKVFYCRKMHL